MDAIIVIGLVIAAVVIFDLLAYTRGVDSRPGFAVQRPTDRILSA